MNLDELRTVQSKERRKDSLQHLRDDFYADVADYIEGLKAERKRAAAEADDPFSSPEVSRLTDEIEAAEEVVEAVYERRVGKVVKLASFAAADMPVEEEGMTGEERELFDDLVARIERNKTRVLDVLFEGGDGTAETGTNPLDAADTTSTTGADATDSANTADAADATTTTNATDPTDAPPDGRSVGADAPADSEAPRRDSGPGIAGDESVASSVPSVDSDDDGSSGPSIDTDDDGSSGPSIDSDDDGGSRPSVASDDGVLADAMGDGPERTPGEGSDPAPGEEAGNDETARSDSDGPDERVEVDPDPAPPEPAGGSSSDRPADGRPPAERTDDREPAADRGSEDLDRTTVRITRDVGEIFGIDEREYVLAAEDVVTLPSANAEPLIERDAAERID